jgi:RNA polymerase sigma-70 factor (ECF subfamily)
MTVWDHSGNIDEKKNFKSYIFKIAKNRMIDMYRKFLKTEPLQPDTVAVERQTPESVLLEVEKRKILQEAVDRLSPQQKKIYMLHYEQKKCLKEIAIEMNISLSAVQNYVNKVRKKIIDYFEKKNYF